METWAATDELRSKQIELLLTAYEGERAYDAQTLSTLTGVFATIIGVLSIVGSAVAFGYIHPVGLPKLITILLPIVPLPFLGWGAVCAHTIIVRGEVIAMYEAALRSAARLRIGVDADGRGAPVPFGGTLVGRVWWGRSGIMLANFFVIGAMYIGILALSAYLADARRADWGIGVVSIPCLAGFGLLLHTYLQAFRPREFMDVEAEQLFGTKLPFQADHRPKRRVWKWIGGGGRAKWPYVSVIALAAAAALAVMLERQSRPPVPSSETRAIVQSAQLAATLNNRDIIWVRHPSHLEAMKWNVMLNGPLCFQIDTNRFDIANMHGFAHISCATAGR